MVRQTQTKQTPFILRQCILPHIASNITHCKYANLKKKDLNKVDGDANWYFSTCLKNFPFNEIDDGKFIYQTFNPCNNLNTSHSTYSQLRKKCLEFNNFGYKHFM